MLLNKVFVLQNDGRRKQDTQVYRESRAVSRLEGDPLKGIVQTGCSALFPPPYNISSETAGLAGSRLAGIRFVQMHTHAQKNKALRGMNVSMPPQKKRQQLFLSEKQRFGCHVFVLHE